jgi:hypothetical protein
VTHTFSPLPVATFSPSDEPTSDAPTPTTESVASHSGPGASLAIVGLLLVVLLGVGGGVGLYLTRDTDPV